MLFNSYLEERALEYSSMVEQSAVNREVVGSSPTFPATKIKSHSK